MVDSQDARHREPSLSEWSFAVALGLLAAAVLIDRVAPAHDVAAPKQPEKRRHASSAGLAAENEDRGRQAKSPSDIPAKGWKVPDDLSAL